MSARAIGRAGQRALLTAAPAVAGVGAGAAAAAAPGELVAQSLRAAATDGDRFSTWIGADGIVHVADARDSASTASATGS